MRPDYDKQTNPRWPYQLDDPAVRARKVAQMYRARLRALDPAACDQADETAASFGETWMLPNATLVEPEQELTTAEAADLINVAPKTLRNWACLDHPEDPTRKLLPRAGRRGRETTYLAVNVLAAKAALLRAQHAATPR